MNKYWLISIITCLLFAMVSCSENDDGGDKIDKEDFIGTWKATSGNFKLTLEITAVAYDFKLEGNGGVYDKGSYDISDKGQITFTNTSRSVLAIGLLKDKKLSLTFVNTVAVMLLGTEAASNTVFTLSEHEENEDEGYLILQNRSNTYDIVATYFYDNDNNLLDTDPDTLEPGYQFTYEIPTGTYIIKVTDDRVKSFTSKSFKVIKDKVTVLEYSGAALDVTATGIDQSQLSRSANNHTILKNMHFTGTDPTFLYSR